MPHDFSSTQVNLSGKLADSLISLGKEIPDSDLADDGRETEPHITVKYGLHTDDHKPIQNILKDEKPITLRLGKTSLFPPNEEDGYEVVKADVVSPDLHRLNKKISGLPHTDTHPEYKPHATVAYVKIGKGKKYVGRDLSGHEYTTDHIIFSSKSGKKVPVHLGRTGRRYYGESK